MNARLASASPAGTIPVLIEMEKTEEGRPQFKEFGSDGAVRLSFRIPSDAEVGVPTKVLITLPDGRVYSADIQTPARGFSDINTTFPAALNGGRAHDDIFKFVQQLKTNTRYRIADCFHLYEKDMLQFLSQVKFRELNVLAWHSGRSRATHDAILALREILRWIDEELPPGYTAPTNIAAFQIEIGNALEKYEAIFEGPGITAKPHRGNSQKREWVY